MTAIVLSLFVTITVAAEVRQFGALQPISIDRSGIVGQNLGAWLSADNGEVALFVWADDRHHSPDNGQGGTSARMAIRLAPDGTPLDEFPIYVPVSAGAVVWREHDWRILVDAPRVRAVRH